MKKIAFILLAVAFAIVIISKLKPSEDEINRERSVQDSIAQLEVPKTPEELKLDSLNSSYIKRGFPGICDALAESDSLYIKAALVAELTSGDETLTERRMKLETKLYKKYYQEWGASRGISTKLLDKDRLVVSIDLNNPCRDEMRERSNRARVNIKNEIYQMIREVKAK